MSNDGDHDASLQQDSYAEEVWSSDEDQENAPPSSARQSEAKAPKLYPIREESRANYSQSSHHHSFHAEDEKSHDRTQRSQSETLASQGLKTSVSFDADKHSFGKIDDIKTEFSQAAKDCHERKKFRAPVNKSRDEGKVHSWEPTPTSLNFSSNSAHRSDYNRSANGSATVETLRRKNMSSSILSSSFKPSANHAMSAADRSKRVEELRRQHAASKLSATSSSSRGPATSTPIAGRSAEPFPVNFSAIGTDDSRRPDDNNASSFSFLKMAAEIERIDADQSSLGMAKMILKPEKSYANYLPKNSILFDKKDSSKLSSSVKPKKQSFILQPILEPVLERDSLSSRPSSTSNAEISISPEPVSHWGFVALNEEVLSKIIVRNESFSVLKITPTLRNGFEGQFKLASLSSVLLQPKASHDFGVIFCPTTRSRFRQKIEFLVTSSGNFYSHTLLGYGGAANIRIVEKSSLSFFPRDGVYRYSPQNPSYFTFDVDNFGERAAFVHIVALDESGLENKSIMVEPESFCVFAQDGDTKTKVTVKLPERYVDQLTRMSMTSVASQTGAKRNRILTLKIYYGDERLRQRAKNYSDQQNKHQTYRGLLLTKTQFIIPGGQKVTETTDNVPVSIQDVEMLKAQTHVLTMYIGDDRMGLAPSRPTSSMSHRTLDGGFYIPECNKEQNSNFSIVNTERTFKR